jgi:hypothetical protein
MSDKPTKPFDAKLALVCADALRYHADHLRLPAGVDLRLVMCAELLESAAGHSSLDGLRRSTDLQADYDVLRQAVRFVLDKFKEDEADGYRSMDRQFAIEILQKALPPEER